MSPSKPRAVNPDMSPQDQAAHLVATGNGPTDPGEGTVLEAEFGEPDTAGVYGAPDTANGGE